MVLLCPAPEATRADQLIDHQHNQQPGSVRVVWLAAPDRDSHRNQCCAGQLATENESPASGPTSGAPATHTVQSWLQSAVHGACYHLSTRRDGARAKSTRLPVPPVIDCSEIPPPAGNSRCGSLRRARVTTAEWQSSKCAVLAAPNGFSTLIEFCERNLKTMCAASAARAQRVTATTSSHVNGCSPVCRLSARASWRPQYPLLTQCTWRSPLATENGRVCRVVDRGRQYHQPRPRFNTTNGLNQTCNCWPD